MVTMLRYLRWGLSSSKCSMRQWIHQSIGRWSLLFWWKTGEYNKLCTTTLSQMENRGLGSGKYENFWNIQVNWTINLIFSSHFKCNDNCKQFRQVVCQDDRHHANITNCPLNTRPHSVQECCHFKWRNLWTPVNLNDVFFCSKQIITEFLLLVISKPLEKIQCSAECGNGTRSRRRVCMRLFVRSSNVKSPVRKKGQTVDERYCKHMKQPPFIPKTRPCRKQTCAAPKWEQISPWTRVSFYFKWKIFHNTKKQEYWLIVVALFDHIVLCWMWQRIFDTWN